MPNLIFEIIGHDRASKAFESVHKSADKVEGKFSKLGAAGGVAFAALAAGAVEFGKKSVDKFQEVGGETIRLQRILGGTATEVSRLRFAAEESGVSADKLGNGFGILSKHLDANDKAWQSLGVNAKDAHGKIRPMAELIPDIAEKFAKLPAGPHKTAEAMKLFGKSGKDLLPFLNKGKTGIEDLGKESDKFGNTLSNKDTAAVKKNVIAKRELNAAISGLQIQLGQKLVPILAVVVGWLTGAVLWFGNLSSGVKIAIGIGAALVGVVFLIVQATKVWTAVQAALNVVMEMNPIGLIILAIAALALGFVYAWKHSETFRKILTTAFDAVVNAGKTAWGWIKGAFGAAKDVFGKLLHGVGAVIAAPFKAAFKVIMAGYNAIIAAATEVSGILGSPGSTFTIVAGASTKHPVSRPKGPHRAGGGSVRAGVRYTVGEHGEEQFVAPANGWIVPNGGSSKSAAMGGGGVTVIVQGDVIGGSPDQIAEKLHRLLVQRRRSIGTGLGLA